MVYNGKGRGRVSTSMVGYRGSGKERVCSQARERIAGPNLRVRREKKIVLLKRRSRVGIFKRFMGEKNGGRLKSTPVFIHVH